MVDNSRYDAGSIGYITRLNRRAPEAVLIVLAILAPAVGFDDATLFNYLNNVEGARPLFYYNGYVHVATQLYAYILSALAPVWQLLGYRILPIAVALLLYRETRALFARWAPPNRAAMIALALVLMVRVIEPESFANVTFVNWPLFLAALLIGLRRRLDATPYSAIELVIVGLAGISFPLGIILPVFFVFDAAGPSRMQRWQSLGLTTIIVSWHAWVMLGSPETFWNDTLARAPAQLVMTFRPSMPYNVVAIAACGVLALVLPWSWRNRRQQARGVRLVAVVMVVTGWASVAAYVASNRFVEHAAAFEGRYTIVVAFCAALAAGGLAVSWCTERVRDRLLGAWAGGAIALTVVTVLPDVRGPFESAMTKYQFMVTSTRARAACRGDEFFIFPEADSPLLTCRRQSMPPYRYPPLVEFTPNNSEQSVVFLLGPKPLF